MVLQLQQVSRTFDEHQAVKDVSLSITPGEIVGILGTSGCGKSTLLRAISGLDPGYDGEILIQGKKQQAVHEEVGFIFQEPRLFPWKTVLDNTTFGLKGKKETIHSIGYQYLADVGLKGYEDYYPHQLSGGMAQRVAIARALATSPEILLLDEPFSALDAFTKMQLQDLLLKIWEIHHTTIVLVTHDIDEALYLCDRIVVIKGQPGTVFKQYEITEKRPRERGSQRLAQYKSDILTSLEFNDGGIADVKSH